MHVVRSLMCCMLHPVCPTPDRQANDTRNTGPNRQLCVRACNSTHAHAEQQAHVPGFQGPRRFVDAYPTTHQAGSCVASGQPRQPVAPHPAPPAARQPAWSIHTTLRALKVRCVCAVMQRAVPWTARVGGRRNALCAMQRRWRKLAGRRRCTCVGGGTGLSLKGRSTCQRGSLLQPPPPCLYLRALLLAAAARRTQRKQNNKHKRMLKHSPHCLAAHPIFPSLPATTAHPSTS